ncbi:hypothetical protein BDW74DRAFT_181745 [Aspergillus multicolor]|uniref:uncharacterized protein n=1 Tax=Aspergillus multicolor TaxID=41759 RepID=UPI003CCD6CB3
MKLTAIVSTILCLGAAQLVAVEAQTSTLTTTVTKTLVRVNAVTPTAEPTSSVPLIHTSTPVASSTLIASTSAATSTAAPSDPVHTGAAASFGGNMPVALAGGAVALLFGAL